jgi:diacylglycerol kinase (ATP)
LYIIVVQRKLVRGPVERRLTTGRKHRKLATNIDTILVVNPNSCSGLTGKRWESLYAEISKALGGNLKVAYGKLPGDGTVLTRSFLKKGYKKIVAVGGDGTINEVANGFFEEPVLIYKNRGRLHTDAKADSHMSPSPSLLKPINPDAIMGVVPCGTRNVLARSLDLPVSVVECCRILSIGRPRKIDVVSATVTNPNDGSAVNTRVFLNAAEIGVGAEIIDRSKKVRKVLNSRLISTVASIVATIPGYQSNECKIYLDHGRSRGLKMTMGIVANGKFLGGGFKVAPHADMSDGFLDVVILKDSGSLKMLDEFVNMKNGNYMENDNIFYRQSRKVALRSKERDVTVAVDGEPIGILPAAFAIIPNALVVRT